MSTSSNENISPQVLRRVAKELTEMSASPPEGIKVYLNEEDMTDVQATIVGPAGTPYEGGVFRMKLVLSNDFPSAPPKGFFLTKIFHPNVSKTGEICVNTLKKDWKPEYGIAHVLMVVKCLLIHPNPESALNEEAGRLLLEQYDDYAKHARMMTSIHARPTKETAATAAAATATTPAAEEGSDATSASASAAAAAAGSAPAASAAAAAAKKPAADKEKDKKKGLKRL